MTGFDTDGPLMPLDEQPVLDEHDADGESLKLPSVKSSALVNALAFATGAATAVMLARVLGASQRGELVIASIGPIIVGVLCTLGVEESTVYLVARSADIHEQRSVAWNGLIVAVVTGLIGTGVATAIQQWYVGPRAGNVDRRALFLYATLPLLVAIMQVLLGTLRGTGRYRLWNVIRMAPPVVYIAIVAAAATTGTLTVASALVAHWLAVLALASYLVLSLVRSGNPVFSRPICKQLIKLGLGNHFITMQRLGNERADQFIMARFVSPHSLGNYAVAATYASCGLQLGLAVGFQLYSHVSRAGGIPRVQFVALCRKSFLVVSGIGVIAAAVGWLVLPAVLGQDFHEAVLPAALLLAGGPPLTVGTLYSSAWKASGEPLRAARAEAFGLLTTGVLLACLVGPWGIIGAAVASVVAYTVVAVVLVVGPWPTAVDAADGTGCLGCEQ